MSAKFPEIRFVSVKEYDEMIKKGILTKYDRVELINGVIVEKPIQTPKHASTRNRISYYFYDAIEDKKAMIGTQFGLWLDDFSEPEPDIVLIKPPYRRFLEQRPTPEDVLLIREVSDSSLEFDRNEKGEAYSRAGIGQYLIVNVENKTIEDYRQPGKDGFGSKQTYKIGEKFTLDTFPEIEINVGDFLVG